MFVKTQDSKLISLKNCTGIYYEKRETDYKMLISINGTILLLGCYDTEEDANLVMKSIEEFIESSKALLKMPTREELSRWTEI